MKTIFIENLIESQIIEANELFRTDKLVVVSYGMGFFQEAIRLNDSRIIADTKESFYQQCIFRDEKKIKELERDLQWIQHRVNACKYFVEVLNEN